MLTKCTLPILNKVLIKTISFLSFLLWQEKEIGKFACVWLGNQFGDKKHMDEEQLTFLLAFQKQNHHL